MWNSISRKMKIGKRACVVTSHTDTVPPYHIFITPLRQESNYKEKPKIDQQENKREVSERSHDKLPPMLENVHLHFTIISAQNPR